MAFGVNIARAAAQDLKSRAAPPQDETDGDAPSAASSVAPHAAASTGPAAPSSDSMTPPAAPRDAAPAFAGRRSPAPNGVVPGGRRPAAPASAVPAQGVPSLPSAAFRPGMPKANGNLRLSELIEQVARFRMMKADEVAQLQADAAREPARTMERLDTIYQNEVLPARTRGSDNFTGIRAQHPEQVHALFVRGATQRIKSWSREEAEATGFALLDGATVDTVHASRTPFPAPSVFKAAAAAKVVDVADAAFETPSDPAPRPRP